MSKEATFANLKSVQFHPLSLILYPLNKLLPKRVMYLSDFIDNIHNVDYLRETLW